MSVQGIPVVWYGTKVDLSGSDSDGEVGRRGQAILAAVHHRIVGSLESAIREFTNQTTSGKARRVTSHFAIGFMGTELTIAQFVALENTAYCNGQTAGDITALTSTRPWRIYSEVRKAAGKHVSANYFTYSTEHEDNGAAGEYVVRPEIVETSIALDRLLLSGDGAAIRAAGIRCSDDAARQLKAIVPSPDTIVDHNVCSPVSKPYCWRPIGKDQGFPQARFLAALTSEDPMLPIQNVKAVAGTVTALTDVVWKLDKWPAVREPTPVKGRVFDALAEVTLPETIEPRFAGDARYTLGYLVASRESGIAYFALRKDVTFTPTETPVPQRTLDLEFNAGIAAAVEAANLARRVVT